MDALLRLAHWLERLVSRIGRLVMWLALPLMLVIVFDVLTRKFFSESMGMYSSKLQDLEWHLNGVLILLLIGYGYLRNTHVRIELFRDGFSTRVRAMLELGGILILVVPLCLLMIYYGYDFALRSFQQNEQSAAMTGLGARWMIKSIIPIGFGVALLGAISIGLKCLVFLLRPGDPPDGIVDYLGKPVDAADPNARRSVVSSA